MPAAEIVFDAPFIVILPAVHVKPAPAFMVIFPVTMIPEAVVAVPEMVRLLKIKPVPDIVLVVPDIVNVLPALWVKEPTPEVDRSPDTEREAAVAEMPDPEMIRLLKPCVPVPLIIALAPVIVIVPVLPVKVPLFVQLPATLCAKAPPVKEVPAPISTKPPKVIMDAAV